MASSESIEIELKFDVDPGQGAPDLRALPGIVGAHPIQTHSLDATYYDTENLDLALNRITMRRRLGGPDAGWHLKRPTGIPGARRELHVAFSEAPSDGPVPGTLTEPVLVHIRTRTLRPVATIATSRTVTRLIGPDNIPVAELAEDIVTAQSLLPGGASQQWAEWEFELLGDRRDPRLLKAAHKHLSRSGGRPAVSESKLARAIGSTPAMSEPRLGKRPSALELLVHDITLHRNDLVAWDPQVRVDAYDAVHQMRVSTRRLRSVLTGFPGVLDTGRTAHLNAELQLLARILGEARDSEVQLEIDSRLLAGEDPSPALRQALVGTEESGHKRALRAAHSAMNSERYFRLLDEIDDFIVSPPAGPKADEDAADAADRAITKSRKQVAAAHAELATLQEGSHEWSEHLHVIRKKAKRLRYRTDAAAPLGKKRHRDAGKVAKEIQSALGDVNDTAINRARLAEIAASGDLAPSDMFVLGRIDARQEATSWEAVARYRKAVKNL